MRLNDTIIILFYGKSKKELDKILFLLQNM